MNTYQITREDEKIVSFLSGLPAGTIINVEALKQLSHKGETLTRWLKAKDKNQDGLTFVRVNDVYLSYGEDAVIAAAKLKMFWFVHNNILDVSLNENDWIKYIKRAQKLDLPLHLC